MNERAGVRAQCSSQSKAALAMCMQVNETVEQQSNVHLPRACGKQSGQKQQRD